jgi:hypothetical protein
MGSGQHHKVKGLFFLILDTLPFRTAYNCPLGEVPKNFFRFAQFFFGTSPSGADVVRHLKNRTRNVMKVKIPLFYLILTLGACATNTRQVEFLKYSYKIISTPEKFAEGIISTKEASEFDICLQLFVTL